MHLFSESWGAGMLRSAGLFGAAFVRGGVGGAVAAGIQDRGKLLQLLEGADPQLFVDVLVVEAQGAVLDVQLLHDLPGAQPGHVAVKDAALGLCQVGDTLQKGLEGIGDRFVAAHVRQPGKLCLHLLALHLQLVHPPSGLPPVLLKLPERRREDVLVEVHAAEHHKKEDEQADQQHLQIAGKDQPAVVRHGDADGQPVGLVLAQAAKLRDACIGAVGADQLGQAAAHAAQHQHVPGGVEVAAGGAAAEGGAGVQPAVCRGKQADQVVKAGGLGKVLLEKALADLKAAQPVHGAVAAPQGQQKQLYLLRGAGEAEPLRQRISLVQRGAAGGHPAVVVRELVGLEFHAPFAVGHHAVGLAHIGAAAVNGSTGAVLNVMPGDTVTLTADTTKFPENEEFGWWEITPYGSVSNTLTGQYQRTATFTMPNENVSARAMSKSAGVSTGGDDGGGGGGAAILLVGGAAVAGLVGYGVYSYVSEQQLKALLPEGVAMPENRTQTALLLWNTAGRPEPSEAPAFKDVADPDTAKAAQWCVGHGLKQKIRTILFRETVRIFLVWCE